MFIVQWHFCKLATLMNVILRENHWVLQSLMLERPVGSRWTLLDSENLFLKGVQIMFRVIHWTWNLSECCDILLW